MTVLTAESLIKNRSLTANYVKISVVVAYSDCITRVVCGYYMSVLARRHADLANRRIRIYDLDPDYVNEDTIYSVQTIPIREWVPK